jgi:ATP-binding cassette subfamily G (WHITE) protein 2 (SNQ2)
MFETDVPGHFRGYVQQMDAHLAQTTVREALLFSAKLRQSPSVLLKEKEA